MTLLRHLVTFPQPNMRLKVFALMLTTVFAVPAMPQGKVPLKAQPSAAAARAANLIQRSELEADLSFLASPDLGGRNAGSSEDHIAADFIASEFMRLGLKPMGDSGTYFQNMDILTASLDREHTSLTINIAGEKHSYAQLMVPRQSIHDMNICGDVVFAGYGIDAPEYHYSDYAGIDVNGKVVVILSGEPQLYDANSKWMGALDTYHAFYWQKVEEARKQGAAAVIIVTDSGPSRTKPIPASLPRAPAGPNYALAGQMWDIPVFNLRGEIANQLLAPVQKNVADLKAAIDSTLQPNSFAVPTASACATKAYTNVQHHPGRNVVALLEGSDPVLKAQTILVTAHHDHMGTVNGHIYYGADDNGSGVTGVLEIARAFVRGHIHPKRSVLFVAFDGEERIFLGSYYYITHPAVALANTVAMLNMDMIGRDEEDSNWPVPADGNANMVNVLGTRYNPSMRQVFARANQVEKLKLDYKMDTVDPDSLWSRSDHFWFAALHIPQVEFQTGLHHDYHTENDTWQRINYPKLTKIIRLVFLSVADIAASKQAIPFNAAGAPPGP